MLYLQLLHFSLPKFPGFYSHRCWAAQPWAIRQTFKFPSISYKGDESQPGPSIGLRVGTGSAVGKCTGPGPQS